MFNNFRVYLRALELDDYKASIKWRKDEEIWDMVGGPKYFVSKAYEKKWVEDTIYNNNNIILAICLKENDEHIGYAYITDIHWINRTAQSHSIIGEKELWSKGLATEARMLLLHFAFYERGLKRIWALILEENLSSQRMCEKCGYKKEGFLRESIFKNGEMKNQVLMSVLRHEYDDIFLKYNDNKNGDS